MDVEVGAIRVSADRGTITLRLHDEEVTMTRGEAAVLGLALTEMAKED